MLRRDALFISGPQRQKVAGRSETLTVEFIAPALNRPPWDAIPENICRWSSQRTPVLLPDGHLAESVEKPLSSCISVAVMMRKSLG
jgi:hypothetical protein